MSISDIVEPRLQPANSPFGGYPRSGFGRDPGSRALDPYANGKPVRVAL